MVERGRDVYVSEARNHWCGGLFKTICACVYPCNYEDPFPAEHNMLRKEEKLLRIEDQRQRNERHRAEMDALMHLVNPRRTSYFFCL